MGLPARLRALDLPGFPTVPLGMMWRDNEDKWLRIFREEVQKHAKKSFGLGTG